LLAREIGEVEAILRQRRRVFALGPGLGLIVLGKIFVALFLERFALAPVVRFALLRDNAVPLFRDYVKDFLFGVSERAQFALLRFGQHEWHAVFAGRVHDILPRSKT